MGNRDRAAEFPAWVDRAGRALANHKENFPLFLTAVLVVTLTARGDALSVWGSIVYVVARIVHGLVYVAGVTGIGPRPTSWACSRRSRSTPPWCGTPRRARVLAASLVGSAPPRK